MAVTIDLRPEDVTTQSDQPQIAGELAETETPEPETEPDENETEPDEVETDDDSDDDADQDDLSTLAEIKRTEAICGELESEIAEIRETLKERKKEYDGACIRLRKLCRSLTEDLPLFDRPQVAEAATVVEDELDDGTVRIARGELLPEYDPVWVEIIEHPDFDSLEVVKVTEFYREANDHEDKNSLYAMQAEGGEAVYVQPDEYRVLDYYEEDLPEKFTIVDELFPSHPAKPQDDNAWRSASIEDLQLDQIKGFGKKKRDALYEACPTMGDLEDLRAEASKQHKQFSDVLPDGFGQKLADEIENAIIEWMAR